MVLKKPSSSSSSSSSSPNTSTTQLFDTNATRLAFNKFKSNPTQLWRGYTALAARNLPFTAMQFPLFEHLRTQIHQYRRRHNIATNSLLEAGLVTAVSAGSAGSVAAVITTPIDVVKTRIMLSAASAPSHKEPQPTSTTLPPLKKVNTQASALTIGKQILETEGAKALFRGGALRGLWTAMGSGLYLGVYESARRFLEDRKVVQEEE
ncbi:MAG: hypothetical protein Q9190_008148 [Brigantiaea leucoxantha]